MAALYTICPFCEHPTVVRAGATDAPHRCRQCAKAYFPRAAAPRRRGRSVSRTHRPQHQHRLTGHPARLHPAALRP